VINETSPLNLTWSDGTATELAMAASSPGALCVELTEPAVDSQGHYALTAEASLRTADGRLDTTRPIGLEASTDEAALDTVAVSFVYAEPVEPDAFASTFGLSGVDLGGHTAISLLLNLAYVVGDASTSAAGELRVVGLPPTDCVDTATAACGSPGQQPIETAAIATP
jgi:hypothetical protein